MPLDPSRTVAELRELRELTGDENGAQRVAWTPTWNQAKQWLAAKLDGLGLEYEVDPAGNQWWTLRGDSERAVLLGGHIDSVPNGGWLDGCLNVVAAVEVVRRIAEEGTPPVTVRPPVSASMSTVPAAALPTTVPKSRSWTRARVSGWTTTPRASA